MVFTFPALILLFHYSWVYISAERRISGIIDSALKKKRNWLCCVRVSNSRLLCRRRKYPLKTYAMGFVNEQN